MQLTRGTSYDVAEHLHTPEDMTEYLDAWRDEVPNDAAGMAKAIANVERAKEGARAVRGDRPPTNSD